MTVQYLTLVGDFTDASGDPQGGQLTITPSAPLTDPSGEVIVPQVPVIVSVHGGAFSVQLLPCDAAGVSPTGWAYTVLEQLSGPSGAPVTRTYAIQPTGTGTVNLADLVPVTPAPPVISYVPIGGGTMTGPLILSGDPATALQAADREYVDAGDGGTLSSAETFATSAVAAETTRAEAAEAALLPLAGGTLTGALAVPGGAVVPSAWLSVRAYGAVGNGTHDDTAAIQAAVNAVPAAGGVVYLPTGAYLVSTPITAVNPTTFLGDATLATQLVISASFSGAAVLAASGLAGCGVVNLLIQGKSSTYSSNPACDAIKLVNCPDALVQSVRTQYVNGYGVEITATGSSNSYWPYLDNVHTYQGAAGIHLLGAAGSGYNSGGCLINCNVEQTQAGDGLLIEDTHDLAIFGLEGWNLNGTGATAHVKGNCAAVYFYGVDLGGLNGSTAQPGPCVLVEAGTNGTPVDVKLDTGIVEAATPNVQVTAGTQVRLAGIRSYKGATHGFEFTGTSEVLVDGCVFDTDGYNGGASHYDVHVTSTGLVRVRNCEFLTPQGTGSGQVAQAVYGGSASYIDWNDFTGATAFSDSFPKAARWNRGYNPVGHVTSPGLPTTGNALINPFGSDAFVVITGGTVSAVAIGGTSTGLTSGGFPVPFGQSITLTYSVAPTWTWFLS